MFVSARGCKNPFVRPVRAAVSKPRRPVTLTVLSPPPRTDRTRVRGVSASGKVSSLLLGSSAAALLVTQNGQRESVTGSVYRC